MLQNEGKIENILFFCHCKAALCIAGNITGVLISP